MSARILFGLLLVLTATAASCALPPQLAQAPAPAGPIFVPIANQEVVWERAVDVLHDLRFEVAKENQLDHFIETEYKVGSGFLEPWHKESVGLENRAESTFQSIRRKVILRLIPAEGGYLVAAEAFKEIEDVQGTVANSAGGATFQEATPLQRDLNLVVGQSTPSGWIPLGHDVPLEQALLARLSAAYSR